MKRLLYILTLVVTVFSGCHKKKYPEASESDNSTFYAQYLLNGQPQQITTGQDKYYMYTSFSLDSAKVYNLVGEFKQTSCSSCGGSLKIQLNDGRVSPSNNAGIDVDSILRTRHYSFLAGVSDLGYSISFTGSFNKPYSSVAWDFGDGNFSSVISPTHIYKPGKYQVNLTITAPNGNQSTMTTTLSVNQPNELNAFITSVNTGSTITFMPHVSGGSGIYYYSWAFGDGSTSTLPYPSHAYSIHGGFGVTVKISDTKGKTITCYYNTQFSDSSACSTNFNFSGETHVTDFSELSKALIYYTDANGVTYSSNNPAQPGSSDLEILSVDNFVNNERNEPVKKVKLKFNCMLYHGSQSLSLQGTDVTVGFSYK